MGKIQTRKLLKQNTGVSVLVSVLVSVELVFITLG